MKKYLSIYAIAAMIFTLTSCSKDTEGMTSITYYPVIEIEGDIYDSATAGVAYTDPGYSATLDGEDYTSNVKVTTSLDYADPKPGYYTITYSAVNAEGFSASATRYVLVSDPNDNISGYYTSNPQSFREYNGVTYYGAAYMIPIYNVGGNKYHVTDLLGGWYSQRAGYGSDYNLGGEVEIDAAGKITLVESYLEGWGDSANGLTDGVADPAAGTLSWVTDYTEYNMLFHVMLSK